ncbi:N-acetylmannosamine-6-phosphate 2-epimerase [Cutibacterium equinum]|uniref:Putative N-acetylmannosamine-6-phosphate 2-epimerase n=1 Tax=Cutibacterium equinum TaxID=3016342 RepID=A0ABY7R0T0_9ACTN|nr:N-acetylmannosamine-6-phosphate 2-epimerase [Cutibacterium equinum]WCC80223.1 N-acetylmannosamine-6-phosphate 2-epimerase [Cutibacterium equinum]
MNPVLESLRKGLVVSCQALPGEPMYCEDGGVMPLFARAAAQSGAVGIRANSVRDIKEIRAAVPLPVIGLFKKEYDGFEPYITPTLDDVEAVLSAGADIVAFDATDRVHPHDMSTPDFITEIRKAHPTAVLMADISTYHEAVMAAKCGVDLVGTTLSGYTAASADSPVPNLQLVSRLAADLSIPVIAEGNISTPELAVAALDSGAHAVVVAGAITRPAQICTRFVDAIHARLAQTPLEN